MPSCTLPSLFFRPCRNFSDNVGIFPTMSEFFRTCPISKEEFFPSCRNFSPFPSYMPGKKPSLLTEGIPAYLMQKNAVGGSKNIPLTAEGIFCRMYGHIPQKCRKAFPFFTVHHPHHQLTQTELLLFTESWGPIPWNPNAEL